MSTKPSTVPVWNTGGDNNTEPAAGKKVDGWLIGEQPPSSYFNWLQKLTGEWLQYLSDGAFTGAATFASTLGIAGALTAAAATFSGLITASAGVTAAANQHVTVSGTGRFKHGDMVRTVTAQIGESTNWTPSANYMLSGGASILYVSIPFDEGQRVKSLTFSRYGDASANVVVDAYTVSSGMTDTNIGGTTVTAPAASWADTTIDLTDSTLASGETFRIAFNASAANIRIGNIRVTYDRP